jgi:hypothetical protein
MCQLNDACHVGRRDGHPDFMHEDPFANE